MKSSHVPDLYSCKNQKCKDSKPLLLKSSKNISKINSQKFHRRAVSTTEKLVPLKGTSLKKAPKIYENQIFRDIYDELGNHDRVLVTVESIDMHQEDNNGIFSTFNKKSSLSPDKFIVPSESYKSFEVENNDFRKELLDKLKLLQNEKGRKSTKKLTLDARHSRKSLVK